MKKILLVEDEPQLLELLGEAFTDAGFPVTVAAHGNAALEVLRNAQPGEFGIVVTDIRMPNLSGTELRRVWGEAPTSQAAPLNWIALTAQPPASPDELHKLESLFQYVFFKPYRLSQLVGICRSLMPPELDEKV